MRWLLPYFTLAAAIQGCEPARHSALRPGSTPPSRDEARVEATGRTAHQRETVASTLCWIFRDLDADCDRRITVEDEGSRACTRPANERRPLWPYAARIGNTKLTLGSPREAAQLVQELVLALSESNGAEVHVDFARARLDPPSYLAERIEHDFWDALTRRIDADPEGLARAASDEKLGIGEIRGSEYCPEHETRCARCQPAKMSQKGSPRTREAYVYYPSTDTQARSVFQTASVPGRLIVGALPKQPTAQWVSELNRTGRHGLLALALDAAGKGRPFVVPGGRFNEMYGWDSFFIAWGLLQDPARIELARSIADNQAYEIVHYGKILNANRTYYLTRSQPPFLTSLLSEIWRRLPDNSEHRAWLERSLRAAIREYRTVWSARARRLQPNVCGATLVTPAMAKTLAMNALKALEAPGGLLASAPDSLAGVRRPTVLRRAKRGGFETFVPGRQWEAPNGWAPHQMLAWVALANAGFESDARRLRYRWLYTIVTNAASHHGTVPEKFDVMLRSHAVFQEYGNVNTEFSYIADEGFGWMNASFVVGWRALEPELREPLKKLVPPEQLFDAAPLARTTW